MTILEAQQAAERETAWRQVVAAAGVAAAGDILGALIAASFEGWRLGNALRVAHTVLSLAVLAYLLLRPAASIRTCVFCFLVLIAPLLPLVVVWALEAPEARVIEPFIAQKLIIIGLALLTPRSLVLGVCLVVAISVESATLSVLRLAGHRGGEPWVTVLYAVFAIGFLVYRASERRLAAELIRAHLEAAALERIAKSSLEVRDHLNTPLQTLEVGLSLLRRKVGDEKSVTLVTRLQSATERLKVLSHRLAGGDT